MSAAHALEFETMSGVEHLQLSKVITSPRGNKFRAVKSGSTVLLVNEAQPGQTIIVTGSGNTSVALLGGIGDVIGDALTGLLKLLTCKPVTTTTVETHKDGTCTVTMKTECAPA